MPSLGSLLKKKRTKDGASNDASHPSESKNAPPSTSQQQGTSSLKNTISAPTSGPVAPASAGSSNLHLTKTAPGSGAGVVAAGVGRNQQQQNDIGLSPAQRSSPDSQHPPPTTRDAEVKNAALDDGDSSGNNNSTTTEQPSSLKPNTISPPSTSPGTDPTKMHQQQQQSMPVPQSPPDAASSSKQHAGDGAADSTQQQQQQQGQRSHHQHQSSQGLFQPRVTKGKYTLVDFDILRTLGTGSFGRVHLVQSKHNQRFYAIKVLKKAQVVKMKQVEHTNDERRMLSDVKHPFLITLWGTFQDIKNLYMVMDFVEGGELFSLLRKSGRFPNPVAKFYAAEVTLALEYLHTKNVVYRDLKPENLLLDRHGHIKITDFGFAKRVPDKTWTLCGTPDYLAPEVVSNKGYNKSVDWWSLGILIYEMLCGYTPFWDSGSPMKIYENILKGKIKYPAYINQEAQDLLQRLITADLTKRLGNLYGGSQDVKDHPWFAEVTWDRLARKDIDAPYTPPVKAGAGDASQFDRYPEDPEKYGDASGSDEYGHMFADF